MSVLKGTCPSQKNVTYVDQKTTEMKYSSLLNHVSTPVHSSRRVPPVHSRPLLHGVRLLWNQFCYPLPSYCSIMWSWVELKMGMLGNCTLIWLCDVTETWKISTTHLQPDVAWCDRVVLCWISGVLCHFWHWNVHSQAQNHIYFSHVSSK